MSELPLILAVPSKGRLMEASTDVFTRAGLKISKKGHERGYRGMIEALDEIEVVFLSASEIAQHLKNGLVHMGITGEDLIREAITDADEYIDFIHPLGFGHADVVVAVPECWIDVSLMSDLEEVAAIFHQIHGRRLHLATKYMNLSRRFFASKAVTGYRIIESLGATEGTAAAGTSELIVDISSTGSTLRANHLKILEDGVILKSEAHLFSSRTADWSSGASDIQAILIEKLGFVLDKPAS